MPPRLSALAAWGGLLSGSAYACGACRPSIRTLIFTPDFPVRFSAMLGPVLIVLAIGILVHVHKEKSHAPP